MQLLVTPRAAGRATVEKWIVGGSAAAIVSGAYSLSSNWTATGDGGDFGGAAWVLAYTVAERTQEIGLRRALGAPAARVLGLVMSQGLAPLAVGIALGIAATISASSVSETQLFGISPTDPQTYVLVAAGVLAAAVLACVLPARRAVRVSRSSRCARCKVLAGCAARRLGHLRAVEPAKLRASRNAANGLPGAVTDLRHHGQCRPVRSGKGRAMEQPPRTRVVLVAGATRGAVRGIARMLGEALPAPPGALPAPIPRPA